MYNRRQDKYLTKLERKRFDMIAACDSIHTAAAKLGIDEGTLYNWFWNLRNRWDDKHGWCNAVLAQRRRSKLLEKLLTRRKRKPLGREEDLLAEEEEWEEE